MTFVTNSIYQFSWGPIPWVYAAEVGTSWLIDVHQKLLTKNVQIFPSRIRAIGTSVGVSTQWLFNFTFSLATPYMIRAWSTYVFIFYAILDLIMATLAFLFIKETKNKTLEEMEAIFHSKAAFDNEAVRRKAIKGEEIEVDKIEYRAEIPDQKA